VEEELEEAANKNSSKTDKPWYEAGEFRV